MENYSGFHFGVSGSARNVIHQLEPEITRRQKGTPDVVYVKLMLQLSFQVGGCFPYMDG